MDDDKNDDFFSNSFFGGFFDKHFQDAMRDMDEMFRKLGDFHFDIHPPSMTIEGNCSTPGHSQSPRDMMLKESSSTESNDQPHNMHEGKRGRVQSPFYNLDFNSPFNNRDQGNVSELTVSPGANFGFTMSGQSTSITHNPDGSIEKIVKRMENGQTCTTITKTDREGNTSSTTTCDRPGDIPNIRDKPLGPPSPFSQPQVPRSPHRGSDSLNDTDKTIFQRYFKDWFKPKD